MIKKTEKPNKSLFLFGLRSRIKQFEVRSQLVRFVHIRKISRQNSRTITQTTADTFDLRCSVRTSNLHSGTDKSFNPVRLSGHGTREMRCNNSLAQQYTTNSGLTKQSGTFHLLGEITRQCSRPGRRHGHWKNTKTRTELKCENKFTKVWFKVHTKCYQKITHPLPIPYSAASLNGVKSPFTHPTRPSRLRQCATNNKPAPNESNKVKNTCFYVKQSAVMFAGCPQQNKHSKTGKKAKNPTAWKWVFSWANCSTKAPTKPPQPSQKYP